MDAHYLALRNVLKRESAASAQPRRDQTRGSVSSVTSNDSCETLTATVNGCKSADDASLCTVTKSSPPSGFKPTFSTKPRIVTNHQLPFNNDVDNALSERERRSSGDSLKQSTYKVGGLFKTAKNSLVSAYKRNNYP